MLTEVTNPGRIRTRIDGDEGLKSKRKLLSIASLILIAICFSGAKITKANTFLFNIEFSNSEGLGKLLFVSVIFLMIRYYNYSKKYHEMIYTLWTNRFLSDPYISHIDPKTGNYSGIINNLMPQKVKDYIYDMNREEINYHEIYRCNLFSRSISFLCYDLNSEIQEDIPILWNKKLTLRNYIQIINLEFKHQFSCFLTHRENLDLLSPYILGTTGISCYLANNYLLI